MRDLIRLDISKVSLKEIFTKKSFSFKYHTINISKRNCHGQLAENKQRFRQAHLTNCRPRITQSKEKSAKLVLRNNGMDVRAVGKSENLRGINPRPFEGKCFCYYF